MNHKSLRSEEFIMVKSRSKRGLRNKGGHKFLEKVNVHQPILKSFQSLTLQSEEGPSSCLTLTNEIIMQKLQTAQVHLQDYGFLSYFQKLLIQCLQTLDPTGSTTGYPNPSKIVCFGLGSFSECVISRYQLGALIELKKGLDMEVDGRPGPGPVVELFDPMFCAQETAILEELGFTVLKVNEEGKRSVEDVTIFYLPHVSHQLVNNILFANWEVDRLKNCVIISNSFSNITNSVPPRLLSKSLSFISRIGDICQEFEVKNSFEYSDIFNDTAIHVFSKAKICDKMNDFWLDRVCPEYQDSDFVKSNPSGSLRLDNS